MKLIAALLVASTVISSALDIPELKGRVNDYADVLLPNEEQALTSQLEAFEKETSNQVVILTMPKLEGSLEKFGLDVGRTWKIGQKGKNNGVVLIHFPNERKVRVEVGYGLEAVLPDTLCSQIISKDMGPFFKNKKFFMGFQAAITTITKASKGEFTTAAAVAGNSFVGSFWFWFLLVTGILFLLWIFAKIGLFDLLAEGASSYSGNSGSSSGSSSSSSSSYSGGGGSFGGGGASGGY